MTTPASNPTLDMSLLPSRQLLLAVMAMHLLAALLVLLLDIALWWRAATWLLIGLHAAYAWHHMDWIRRLRALQFYNGDFYMVTPEGKWRVTADQGHFVTPWLIILHLQHNGKQRFLPLFSDASDADSLRRLRVLLRCRV